MTLAAIFAGAYVQGRVMGGSGEGQ